MDCAYSSIEHLAKTVALSRFHWKEVQFGMFTACFDASGTIHDQGDLVIAGFISTADVWIDFDRLWRKRLAEDGLEYFHMVDFAHHREQFASGWKGNEPRRRALLEDLMKIIRSHAFRRFGCVIENQVFLTNVSENFRSQYLFNAYVAASMVCVGQVSEWCSGDGAPVFEKIRFVFEAGDAGQAQLEKRFRNDLQMSLSFEYKTGEQAFTPLQAADFFAYELLLGIRESKDRTHPPRWPLLQFLEMQGTIKTMEDVVLSPELERIFGPAMREKAHRPSSGTFHTFHELNSYAEEESSKK